jgi:hypothetical protein
LNEKEIIGLPEYPLAEANAQVNSGLRKMNPRAVPWGLEDRASGLTGPCTHKLSKNSHFLEV